MELKVIALQEGIIPSEVAHHTYEIKEGKPPIQIEPQAFIKRVDLKEQIGDSVNLNEILPALGRPRLDSDSESRG